MKVLAVREMQQMTSVWKTGGCPTPGSAGSNQVQHGPFPGHSWSSQLSWCTSEKIHLRKNKIPHKHWGPRRYMCEKQSCRSQGLRRWSGRRCPRCWSRFACCQLRGPWWNRYFPATCWGPHIRAGEFALKEHWPAERSPHCRSFIPKNCSLQRIHAAEGKQREEEGAAERNGYGLTATPILHPLALLRVYKVWKR